MWGYDVASPAGAVRCGDRRARSIPAVGQASKTGWFYVLDRRDGKLLYKSEPFVPQQQSCSNGPPPEGIDIAPGAAGGASWSPVSYDARTGLAYVAALHMPTRYTVHEIAGYRRQAGRSATRRWSRSTGRSWGTLTAIDTRAQAARFAGR